MTTTFLLTDVVGSTALWEEAPEAAAAALTRLDALLEGAVAAAGGVVVAARGEGDSRFAVFEGAAQAAAAAAAVARAVTAEQWGTPRPVALRMALHTGEAGERYYGPEVNRAIRLRAAAHPGQVLVSPAAAAALGDGSVVDLGWHRLGELSAPERVFQLAAPGLPASFPPLASAPRRHNLPEATTSFVGRELEVAEVAKLLAAHRLVTVVGVGGAGKTRLALEVAARLVDDHRHGVWVVELAALADPALVAPTAAAALGVREQGGRDLLAALCEHLRERELVLVLDNCEHLVDAAAGLARRLLAGAAGLRILATSRQPLGVVGELSWPIPPLETPAAAHLRPDAIYDHEATELFWQRATAARPGLVLDAPAADATARVCARLEGLPLAIELAAARAATLPLDELDRRLDDRLGALAADGLPGRQRTLRAAIDWSHDLLEPSEQVLFRRLAAFAGSFSLEAAEAVCPGGALQPDDVLDQLAALVAKSLVTVEERGARARYRLLETIRAYAAERLDEAGEADDVAARHLEFFMAEADEERPRLRSPDVGETLERLEDDHDNYRRALRWALDAAHGDDAIRLTAALGQFWDVRGYWTEGRAWTEEALRAGSKEPSAGRAYALIAVGEHILSVGDRYEGAPLFEEALAVFRRLNDPVGVAEALTGLAASAQGRGSRPSDPRRAKRLQEQALAAWKAAGTTLGYCTSISSVYHNLGQLAWPTGDRPRARQLFEAAVDEARRQGNHLGLPSALAQLAIVEDQDGNHALARRLCREALPMFVRRGDQKWTGVVLRNLAMIAVHEGKAAEAAAYGADGLSRLADTAATSVVTSLIEVTGWATAIGGASTDAARVLGAAEARRERYEGKTEIGTGTIQAQHDTIVEALRSALDDDALAKAWAEGKGMSLEETVDLIGSIADRLAATVPA